MTKQRYPRWCEFCGGMLQPDPEIGYDYEWCPDCDNTDLADAWMDRADCSDWSSLA